MEGKQGQVASTHQYFNFSVIKFSKTRERERERGDEFSFLVGAPGLTTRSKKLLGAPGLTRDFAGAAPGSPSVGCEDLTPACGPERLDWCDNKRKKQVQVRTAACHWAPPVFTLQTTSCGPHRRWGWRLGQVPYLSCKVHDSWIWVLRMQEPCHFDPPGRAVTILVSQSLPPSPPGLHGLASRGVGCQGQGTGGLPGSSAEGPGWVSSIFCFCLSPSCTRTLTHLHTERSGRV